MSINKTTFSRLIGMTKVLVFQLSVGHGTNHSDIIVCFNLLGYIKTCHNETLLPYI